MLWFPVLETCTKYPTFNKQSQEAKQSSQLDENAQVSILIATDHSQAVLCRIILSRVQETVQRCVQIIKSEQVSSPCTTLGCVQFLLVTVQMS